MSLGELGKITSSIKKENYRTSVLYDFSSVVKAVIYILEATDKPPLGEVLGITKSWRLVKALPVQINPTQIRRARGNKYRETGISEILSNIVAESIDSKSPKYSKYKYDHENDNFEISLKFDIYDEYRARIGSSLGMGISKVASNFFSSSISSDMPSLANENVTIIEELYLYSSHPNCFGLFVWGDIIFLGRIINVSCNYDCFSAYGQPLKADVSVTLKREPLGKKENVELEPDVNTLGISVWNQIMGYTSANNLEIMAAKIAEDAAVVTMPSILRTIQND